MGRLPWAEDGAPREGPTRPRGRRSPPVRPAGPRRGGMSPTGIDRSGLHPDRPPAPWTLVRRRGRRLPGRIGDSHADQRGDGLGLAPRGCPSGSCPTDRAARGHPSDVHAGALPRAATALRLRGRRRLRPRTAACGAGRRHAGPRRRCRHPRPAAGPLPRRRRQPPGRDAARLAPTTRSACGCARWRSPAGTTGTGWRRALGTGRPAAAGTRTGAPLRRGRARGVHRPYR